MYWSEEVLKAAHWKNDLRALFYENHRGKCINCIYLYISRDNKIIEQFFFIK